MPAVRVVDEHLLAPVLVYSGTGGVFQNELLLDTQGGIVRQQIGDLLVVKNDFAVVAALTGSVFSGPVTFLSGATGSIQKLPDGSPYLAAGSGISISTGSNGQITISSTGGSGSLEPNNSNNVLTELVLNETPSGVMNGINKSFSLAFEPANPLSVMLWLNGQLLTQGASQDYTVSGKTILFGQMSLEPGDTLVTMYPRQVTVKRFSLNEPAAIVTISGSLALQIGKNPDPVQSLMVFRNGQLLTQNVDYASTNNIVQMIAGNIEIDDIFLATYSYSE